MAKKTSSGAVDPIQKELDAIKRLLVLLLLKIGTEGKEIAVALDVVGGTVSKMIPKNAVKVLNVLQTERRK